MLDGYEGAETGRVTVKRAPLGCVLAFKFLRRRQIRRSRPEDIPLRARALVSGPNRSKTRVRSVGGIPGPSRDIISTHAFRRRPRRHRRALGVVDPFAQGSAFVELAGRPAPWRHPVPVPW